MKIKKRRPVYQVIKEKIKEGIFSSKLTDLSESQIIHKFGVSNTTARKVLNDLEEEGLIERKAGKGSSVVFNKEKEIKEVGVIFFDIYDTGNPYISNILQGIEEKSKSKNYNLHIFTTRHNSISKNKNLSIYHIITKRKIDGLFILSPIPPCDIELLVDEKIPFVSVGNDYYKYNIPTVLFDYKGTMKEIGSDLLEMNYRKIGVITGPRGEKGIMRGSDYFLIGYKEFLKENNLPYNKQLFLTIEKYNEEVGYKTAEYLYSLGNERPDAIIVTSYITGKGISKFIQGKKDWQPFVILFSEKEITSPYYIFTPYNILGKSAFELLGRYINKGNEKAEKITVPFEIRKIKQ